MGAKHLEGLVRKGIGGFYTVETPEGLYTCTARGKFRKARISPYAGDRVRILAEEDGSGALEEILPRRNFLVRPPIANIDQLFIVSSLRDPYPEPLIVDKTIAVAELEDIQPILVLTKTDLEGPSPLKEVYDLAGVPCLEVSSVTGQGVDQVRQLLAGKVSAFTSAETPVWAKAPCSTPCCLSFPGRPAPSAKSWAAAATPPVRWSSTSWKAAAMWRIPPASPPLTSSATA